MLRIERFPEKQPVDTFYVHVLFYLARLNWCARLNSFKFMQTSTDFNGRQPKWEYSKRTQFLLAPFVSFLFI